MRNLRILALVLIAAISIVGVACNESPGDARTNLGKAKVSPSWIDVQVDGGTVSLPKEEIDAGKMEPRLRDIFLDMVGAYPIGTVVKLDTGEMGVVTMREEEDPLRPKLQVVTDPDGQRLDKSVAVELTETRNGGGYARSIAEAVDPYEHDIDPLEALQEVLGDDGDRGIGDTPAVE